MNSERVAAVVVAYNRRALLLETLDALASQTRHVDVVLVVDNASTDGSADAVRAAYPEANIETLPHNTGGAGGFTAGIERAINKHGADLVWLMDDDTVPTPSALEGLLRARRAAPTRAVLFASEVRWTDGRPHPMNMPRVKPFASARSRRAAAAHNCYPVRSASFVSLLVDSVAVKRAGLPVADYFLWNDDFEFTTRLLRGARGYVCTESVVIHKTKVFGSTDADPGERFMLEVRNKIWLLRFSRGLAPFERILYAGSTLVRWSRTFLRSSERAVLRRCLMDGIRQGLFGRPRSNSEVLAMSPVIAAGTHTFELDARG